RSSTLFWFWYFVWLRLANATWCLRIMYVRRRDVFTSCLIEMRLAFAVIPLSWLKGLRVARITRRCPFLPLNHLPRNRVYSECSVCSCSTLRRTHSATSGHRRRHVDRSQRGGRTTR